jgi:DivIVA domain-containing protein
MFDPRKEDTSAAPPERIMRVSPLDVRQQRFKKVLRGYDRAEVVAFLTEAADDYEQALLEIDKLREDVKRLEALLCEHR